MVCRHHHVTLFPAGFIGRIQIPFKVAIKYPVPSSRSVRQSEKNERAVKKRTSEKRRKERRGEPVSIFSNTSIRADYPLPPPRQPPHRKKQFLALKCQTSKSVV